MVSQTHQSQPMSSDKWFSNLVCMRMKSTVTHFTHGVNEKRRVLEESLSPERPWVLEHLPLASATQKEIIRLHDKCALQLNKDDFAASKPGLPYHFATSEYKNFFFALIRGVNGSLHDFKEEKPRKLLNAVLEDLRDRHQEILRALEDDLKRPKEYLVRVPYERRRGVIWQEIIEEYGTWVKELTMHKEKWVWNWESARKIGSDLDYQRMFDEEIARVSKGKEAFFLEEE